MKKKRVLVGIDGAPFTALKKMSDEGVMPFFKQLREEGTFRQLMASIPDNSAVSWSSIMTGTNPGEHGIFGFTDLIPGTYTMSFPNFRGMKAAPFWQQDPERKSVVINLPFTYPAGEINGRMVSGFVSPNLEHAVYPPEFLDYLKSVSYGLDVDTRKIYQSKELFYNDLMEVHKTRCDVYRKQFADVEWDTFMIVFTGSDRLGHYMWDCYEDENDPFHERFLDYYRSIDQELEWIHSHIDADDTLVMMSDHGMEQVKKEVNLNYFLQKEGFQEIDDNKKNYNALTNKTKAFVLEPSRVFLNSEKRFPGGTVKPEEREALLHALTDAFYGLTCDGHAVIKTVHRKEDLYSGDSLAVAPDLLLVSHIGYSLRGSMNRNELFTDPEILVGMHRGDDAFLYVHGLKNAIHVPENPKVDDILGIVAHC